jgi:hypothetical protein
MWVEGLVDEWSRTRSHNSTASCRKLASIRQTTPVTSARVEKGTVVLCRPFEHAESASQLADLRDKLKLGLSEKPPEGGTLVAELAGRIKALRASFTVEASPERVTRKAVRAERPVTARIRKRMAVEEPIEVANEPVVESVETTPEPVHKPEEPPASPPAAVIAMPVPAKPVAGYRQNETRRRGDARQMSLF